MERVFIVHGWGGSPKNNWIPWLKSEIEKMGYEVTAPKMPNTESPEIDEWVAELRKVVGNPDTNTYFIGHSIGCQTILRYLETIHSPVGGALFVAGWFNLENLEDEESKEIAKPWIQTPIDISKVTGVLPKSILIISTNDDYGAVQENIKKFSSFVAHTSILPNAGHITEDQEPAVLDEFSNLVSIKS